jgi:ABC-2 type transport system permease protein
MPPSLVIAGKDLRQRLRDRTAYLVGIVAPLALATLFGLAFGRSGIDFSATFAVVDDDHGVLARQFVEVLHSPDLRDVVTVRRVADADRAEQLAEDGDVAAAIVIPNGFSAVTEGASPVPLRVVQSADKPIAADVAVAIAQGFTARIDATQLAAASAVAATRDPASAATAAGIASSTESPIDFAQVNAGRSDVPFASFIAQGMGIFFLFFVVGLGARGLAAERREGTLARLLVAPVRSRSVLAGKALATFVVGFVSLTTMAIASSILLDARWGDLASAALLLLGITFAATGTIALVLTFAHNEQQAGFYASLVTFSFALLGGNFVSLGQAPEILQRIALLTPNGWTLRAFGDLANEGGGLATAWPALLVTVTFGFVTAAIAAARSRRLVAL